MVSKLWRWLRHLWQRRFGRPQPQPQPPAPPPLDDTAYEFL